MAQWSYRCKSNITGSYSIKNKDEDAYFAMRELLKRNRISIGEYLISSYRELDEGAPNDFRLAALRKG